MEVTMSKALVLLCIAVAVTAGAQPVAGTLDAPKAMPPLSILWLYADGRQPDTTLGVRLQALGDVVAYLGVSNSTPTLGQLAPYDAVGAHTNFPPDDPTALGNVLADYVDAGGGVVLANFCFASSNGMAGRIMTGNYATLIPGANGFGTASLGWHNPAHDLMANVTSVSDSFRNRVSFAAGAESVAKWSDGRPYAAVSANQKVVGLNQYPGTWSNPNRRGDWALVIHNALAYVAGMTGVEEPGDAAANAGFVLCAGPNPARQTATIRYSVSTGSLVRLAIYDQSGRLIQARPPSASSLGFGVWELDVAALRQGVYFCRLISGGHALSRKLVVER
jgi:hypothetical protein